VAAWVAVVVVLSLTSQPIVAAGAFAGLTVLAVRRRMFRLLALSLVVGVGMVAAVPGVQLVDGSFSFIYAEGTWQRPEGAAHIALALVGLLRVPAQVLASALLLLVPAERLLAGAARLSPRAALLGGLAARAQPLLARDLRLVRDDLASRGLRVGKGAPIAERARATVAVWEAMLSGVLDRAFTTAAALETRGYGSTRPTTAPFTDPELTDGRVQAPLLDALLTLVALGSVVLVLAQRASGAIAPPAFQAIGAVPEPITAGVVALGAALAALGLLPAVMSARSAAPTKHTPAARHSVAGERRPDDRSTVSVALRDVTMRYPGAVSLALDVAAIDLRPGELVIVAGLSGSGKSTLLDVISGVAPRASGGTRSGEVRLGDHVARQGVGRGVAAVFQDPESQILVGHVAEEVAFGLRHTGVHIREIERRVRAALEQLGVLHLARRDCATLSGGELQRVLLAAAIALEPAVLVLDEPTSQIDATSERRFWDAVDLIRADRGVAVLAAEHRLEHVLVRCDRVLVFDRGRIVAQTTPAALHTVAPELLTNAYAGLVPNLIAREQAPRLTLHIDRVEVGDGQAARAAVVRSMGVAIPPRGIVTLEGANGTGKSTLLRAIRGLHPIQGSVLVDGVDRGELGASTRQIAYLAQHAGALMSGHTVLAGAQEACHRLGLDAGPARAALIAAGLGDRYGAHPSELSVGERQRLVLIAATAHRPPIWLLDEPTRGMDAHARRWVACHVLAHAATGGVVLVATHDSAFAAAIATHRLRLDLRAGPTLLAVRRDAAGRPLELDRDDTSHASSASVALPGSVT